MEQESLGTIMLREMARAIPWGVMLLIVFLVAGVFLKQEVKESVEYSLKTVIQESKQALLSPEVFIAVKQNAKEAIQYATKEAAGGYLHAQRQLKADMPGSDDLAPTYLRKPLEQ